MAVTASNYFANAIVGVPQVGTDYDIYDVTADTPKYAVGTGFERSDGNKYRYVHYGEVTEQAEMVSQDLSESCISAPNIVINPTSAGKPDFEPVNMGAVGSHYVEATLTLTANQLAGAYMGVYSGTGYGCVYRVRGNTTPDSTRSGASRIQLYDPIHVALDQTTGLSIIGSRYANLEPSTTSATGAIGGNNFLAGVAVAGASANNYGWVCSRGITMVTVTGNTTAGAMLTEGGIAGTVHTANTNNNFQIIGRALTTQKKCSSWANAYVQFE